MMRTTSRIVAALAATFAVAAGAMDGPIAIDGAWSRAMPAVARNGAAYMVLHNKGDADDRLIAAESSVSARTELHDHVMKDGVMKMTEVDGIDLPAGGQTTLAPGGLHVMMMELTEPLDEGKAIRITLTFEKAAPMVLDVPVRKGEMPMGGHSGGKHGHGTKHGMQKEQ